MDELPSTARLFLALWPDDATRKRLSERRNAIRWDSGAKLSTDERLHLTLHFIGQVSRDRLPELQAGLLVPSQPVELTLSWLDVWRGGIAVLRPHEVPPSLQSLQLALGARLSALGLPVEEREFRPHVTLARHAPNVVAPDGKPMLWRSSGYVLAESRSGYHQLQQYP